MIFHLYQHKQLHDNYLDIHYKEMDAEVQGVIDYCLHYAALLTE